MNKSILVISAFLAVAVMGCKKDAMHDESEIKVTETVEVTIPQNSSYTYTVPANQSDDPYLITQDAKHAASSVLDVKSATEAIYTYTPERGFVGDDQIIIENVEETHDGSHDGLSGGCFAPDSGNAAAVGTPHHGGHHHGGGCGNDDEEEVERKIILNIHIVGVASKNAN